MAWSLLNPSGHTTGACSVSAIAEEINDPYTPPQGTASAARGSGSKATTMVSEAIAKGDVQAVNYFVAQKYVEAFSELARNPTAKTVIVPAEMSGLVGTIAGLGEEAAFKWWGQVRANGVKVVKGWTEAYYTEFTRNGGTRPIVVSYATSPAAEVFYSKTKLSEPPTASLSLPGAVFRQVEGVALVKGGKQRAAAEKFVEFMRSPAVQTAMQTEMWMYPAEAGVAKADAFRFAPEPTAFNAPSDADIAAKGSDWVARWTKVVLK